jgi:phage FluMu protein Com
MALVSCKECNKKISETAGSCPNCGIANPGISNDELNTLDKRIGFFKQRWIAGIPFWFGVFWLVLPMFTGGAKDEVILAWGLSKWLIGFGVIHYVLSEIERNLFEKKIVKSK